MPRVRAARTASRAPQVPQIVVVEPDDQVEEARPAVATRGLPLFPHKEGVTSVSIYRLEPIEEGNLGILGPDADEETIRRRWGGGVYRATAKLGNGEYAGNATINIGGDPRFESLDARKRYKNKMAGLDGGEPAPPRPRRPRSRCRRSSACSPRRTTSKCQ
jgi:hypothetical protein